MMKSHFRALWGVHRGPGDCAENFETRSGQYALDNRNTFSVANRAMFINDIQ